MAALWKSLCSLGASAPLSLLLRLPGVAAIAQPAAAVSRRPLHLLSSCARVGGAAVAPRLSSGMSPAPLLSSILPSQSSLLAPACVPTLVPQRSYKVRSSLKLRCSGCYFVRRQGRMFVECKLKPRHKQMQVMAARKLFRHDYSKGDVVRALNWRYRTERFYRLGNNYFARHDWLDGKLGHTL